MTDDGVKILEAIRAGERMWRQTHKEPPELKDVIELLIAEACQTMRALVADRPAGFGGSWPDIVPTPGDIQSAYNLALAASREAQERGEAPDPDLYALRSPRKPQPSAAALSRFLMVMDWLRFIRVKNYRHASLRQRLTLLVAAGASPKRLVEKTEFAPLGFNSADAVSAAHYRSMNQIEEKIRARLPENFRLDIRFTSLPIGSMNDRRP